MKDNILKISFEKLLNKIDQLEASRTAYANEFPLKDGEPDVGSIHENIRKLKQAFFDLMDGNTWIEMRVMRGLSDDRCQEIEQLYKDLIALEKK